MLILGHGKQQELLIVLDHLSLSFLMTLLIKIVDLRWWHSYLHQRPKAPCPLQEFNGEGPLCLFAVAYHLSSLSLCLSICICNERLRNWLRAPQLPLQINTIKADIAHGSQTFAYDAYFAPVRCSCIDLDAICASRDFCVGNQMKVGPVVATWGHLLHVFVRKVAQVSFTIYSLHWQWFLLDPSPIMIVVTD